MMALIEFKNVSYKYPKSDRFIIKDINLEIGSGEFVLLIGPTGCGKTTLCRCMNGLIPHFYPGEFLGDVIVEGENTRNVQTNLLATKVGMVFQNPENMLFSLNVEKEIAFGMENLAIPREEMKRKIRELMSLLDIEHLRDRTPYELSGGEQQIVAIASVLALNPKILVLDEPTANLDPLTAMEIIKLLHKLNKEKGITIILVEHRIELILPIATRVILMNDGQIVADAKPREIVEGNALEEIGINIPSIVSLFKELRKNHRELIIPLSVQEAVNEIKKVREQ
ncbi:MAG: ABC transporter ATP-binding protein [Candidatus Odinarchaeota archaeon]|nr:ABC transporter ATP-binding protein [Candidatus Odinarchaeota archaeon]